MSAVNSILGVFFLICIIVGWHQGLFRVIVSTAALVASLVVAIYVAPHVSGFLQEKTQIDDDIANHISKELRYSDAGEELTRGMQVAVINDLPVPESIKKNILNNNNDEMYDMLEATGVHEYISKSVAVVILNTAVFLILMVMSRIFFFCFSGIVKGLTKLPIVKSIDKLGGGVLGAIKGVIYLWLFFTLLSIMSTFEICQQLIEQIQNNLLLNLLYQHNLLLDIVGDLTRVLFH